jgi:hypothetical protein
MYYLIAFERVWSFSEEPLGFPTLAYYPAIRWEGPGHRPFTNFIR